jgi:hypothetical protein
MIPPAQLQLFFAPAYSRTKFMKMRFLRGSLVLTVAGLLVFNAKADPILPYSQPIAVQLTNDINGGSPDVKTLERALKSFHTTSKSLRGDANILRSLNTTLTPIISYAPLLTNAALDYQADFQLRRDEITGQLIPAPISANKTSARTALTRVNNSLSNAVIAPTTAKRIQHLQTAASQLTLASNSVQRALRTRPGLSKMVARIGGLSFNSDKGQVVGGGNFYNDEGGAVGRFSPSGVLDLSAFDSGAVTRGLSFYIEGVSGNFPATYPLGVGANSAEYDATDLGRREEFRFRAEAALTNAVVTNAFVSIDYIGTNSLYLSSTSSIPISGYVLGRFAFVGTNTSVLNANTNRAAVTVSAGEFQLNFDISTNAPVQVEPN